MPVRCRPTVSAPNQLRVPGGKKRAFVAAGQLLPLQVVDERFERRVDAALATRQAPLAAARSRGADVAAGCEPGPGADVAELSSVPVQMGRAQSRSSGSSAEPNPGADLALTGLSQVPELERPTHSLRAAGGRGAQGGIRLKGPTPYPLRSAAVPMRAWGTRAAAAGCTAAQCGGTTCTADCRARRPLRSPPQKPGAARSPAQCALRAPRRVRHATRSKHNANHTKHPTRRAHGSAWKRMEALCGLLAQRGD